MLLRLSLNICVEHEYILCVRFGYLLIFSLILDQNEVFKYPTNVELLMI